MPSSAWYGYGYYPPGAYWGMPGYPPLAAGAGIPVRPIP
ncbi:hypothetical protein Chelonae_p1614 [[Mycobacterium] chelonae subsp. bovistauri]|nr:hypothetical protein Chelonae_p1614 [Mycobacterium sp. QIA-37]